MLRNDATQGTSFYKVRNRESQGVGDGEYFDRVDLTRCLTLFGPFHSEPAPHGEGFVIPTAKLAGRDQSLTDRGVQAVICCHVLCAASPSNRVVPCRFPTHSHKHAITTISSNVIQIVWRGKGLTQAVRFLRCQLTRAWCGGHHAQNFRMRRPSHRGGDPVVEFSVIQIARDFVL